MAPKTSPEERSKPSSVSPAPTVAPARRKAAGTRTWLVISNAGGSHLEDVGKQSIMRRTGLPGRDLRILDPMLSYPSTILGRERAIVVKLEHIKAIITATEVLVQNPKDPAVEAFVKDLESRVSNFYRMPQQEVNKAAWGSHEIRTPGSTSPPSIDALQNRTNSPESCVMMINEIKEGHFTPIPEVSKVVGPNILPFEFRVLEVCLEAACRCLEFETTALEKEAYPALDELTSKISTLNLERVRQIKSRLVAISGRVQKVRDELEHLLDDDMDMAEMHLTEKIVDEEFEETSSKDENDDDAFESNQERYEEYKSKSKSITESLRSLKPNIEELEMLLEAYFVQIEGTLNKLSTMREYVDDTEDYINIMLDDKQNQLLQMGVMLSTATLVISTGIVVVGFFGMNIHIELFDTTPIKFWETTIGTIGGCLVLYLIALMWGMTTGILG